MGSMRTWWLLSLGALVVVVLIIVGALLKRPSYPEGDVVLVGKRVRASGGQSADLVERGRQLYIAMCMTCHGRQANGLPVTPEGLRTQVGEPILARDFTGQTHTAGKVVFKYTWQGWGGEFASDEDLKHVIREGLRGTPMPGFEGLSEEDLDALVAYIKSLHPGWKTFQSPSPPSVRVPSDLDATHRIEEGRALFQQKCVTCHGDPESGRPPIAQPLQWYYPGTDSVLMVTARDFLHEPLRLPDPVDVFRTIRKGIGGTTMNPQTWAELTDDQIWSLVSYIRYLQRQGQEKKQLAQNQE